MLIDVKQVGPQAAIPFEQPRIVQGSGGSRLLLVQVLTSMIT